MKSLRNIFLASLVALCLSNVSYAADGEAVSTEKVETELKTGDVIITEEFTVEPTNPASVKKEEPKVEKPANEKPPQAEKPKEEKEVKETPQLENKADEVKESPADTKKSESAREPITYDPKASEYNKKLQDQQREADKKKEEERQRIEAANQRQREIARQNERQSKEIKELINEFDKFLVDSPTKKETLADKDLKKNINLVTEVVKSDKITKYESEKIAIATKSIVEEYNKKIEEAPSESKKQELRNEAVAKINQSIKETSTAAFDILKESKEKVTIDDQKNEILVFEKEMDTANIDGYETNSSPQSDGVKTEAKSASLARPPRLNQETSPHRPTFSITIILLIVLVVAIAVSAILALKQRDESSK